MKEAINTLVKTFSDYILKPKPVYKYVARIVLLTLLTELASVFLPDELKVNYVTIRNDYGLFAALLFAIFIGKYLGGFSLISLSIKTTILIACLIIDYKIHKKVDSGNKYSVTNFIFGFKNTINNHLH